MGHLANPISTRLNICRVWNSHWSFCLKKNYYYLLNSNEELNSLLDSLVFNKYFNFFLNKGLIVFKTVILKTVKLSYVYIYLYDNLIYDTMLNFKNQIKYINMDKEDNFTSHYRLTKFSNKSKMFTQLMLIEALNKFLTLKFNKLSTKDKKKHYIFYLDLKINKYKYINKKKIKYENKKFLLRLYLNQLRICVKH